MNKERGSILLICIYIVSSLTIIGAAFSVLMANEKLSSDQNLQAVKAMYVAEAGLEKAIYDLRQQYIISSSWNSNIINGTAVVPVTGQFYTLYPSFNFGDGAYSVEIMNGTNATNNMWIKSTGTCGNIHKTIQAYIIVSNSVGPVLSVLGWKNT
jgi:hypothetical protein